MASSKKLTLEKLNNLSQQEFQAKFQNVIEHSTEIIAYISQKQPFASTEYFISTFKTYLTNLSKTEKQQILQNYPDLAGTKANENKLTTDSAYEHSTAGLYNLSSEQSAEMKQLNEIYRQKFGFPCVICVRKTSGAKEILCILRQRVLNESAVELDVGINEVMKICEIRIGEIVQI